MPDSVILIKVFYLFLIIKTHHLIIIWRQGFFQFFKEDHRQCPNQGSFWLPTDKTQWTKSFPSHLHLPPWTMWLGLLRCSICSWLAWPSQTLRNLFFYHHRYRLCRRQPSIHSIALNIEGGSGIRLLKHSHHHMNFSISIDPLHCWRPLSEQA